MSAAGSTSNNVTNVVPMLVSAPAEVRKSTSGSSVVTTPAALATVTGGTGPYTYAWEAVSNPSGMTILNGATDSAQFRKSGMYPGETFAGQFRCLVTDSTGATAYSNLVSGIVDRGS